MLEKRIALVCKPKFTFTWCRSFSVSVRCLQNNHTKENAMSMFSRILSKLGLGPKKC